MKILESVELTICTISVDLYKLLIILLDNDKYIIKKQIENDMMYPTMKEEYILVDDISDINLAIVELIQEAKKQADFFYQKSIPCMWEKPRAEKDCDKKEGCNYCQKIKKTINPRVFFDKISLDEIKNAMRYQEFVDKQNTVESE